MIIKKLNLRNFRNYEKQEIEFQPGLNIIIGNNAQGKTNLLESLVILSLTKSYRILNDQDLIRNGKEHSEISCYFMDEKEKRIDVVIHQNGKTLMINKNICKKSSEFIGLLNVVLFSPDDLSLFNDSPRTRRKLMNQEITKVSPTYLKALTQYHTLLKNRNSILKEMNPDQNYLDILDKQMIQVEKYIIQERRKFINIINEKMIDIYKKLSGDDVKVNVHYACCIKEDDDIEKQLSNMYKSCRKKDLDYHMSTCGIHREDMIFKMDDKDIILLASQGQKRMAVLSFKIALLYYIEKITNKKPVLLLDDVLSELDETRQRRLLEMIQRPYQCLITATDVPQYLKNNVNVMYQVKNGHVEMKERN